MSKVLLVAEFENNHLSPATRCALTASHQLSSEVTVLAATSPNGKSWVEECAQYQGVSQVLWAQSPVYEHPTAEDLAALIAQEAKNYTHVLMAATAFGKNILPRAAALLDKAMVGDVVQIVNQNTYVRPIYAGNVFVTVQSTESIQFVSIRPTAFALQTAVRSTPATVESIAATESFKSSQFVGMESSQSVRPELTSARVVVSGGRGLQSAEQFKLIEALADKLGAAIGASRAAVDAGFAPNDYQVGQTGKVVAPDLYIAVGISGAIQHLAGIKDSKVIVAINKDPDAPIFQIADYGLVGDLFQVVPELIEAL